MKIILQLCSVLLIITSCASNGQSVKIIRPESLLNPSSEKVSFPVTDSSSVKNIVEWIHGDNKPSSAEVTCAAKDKSCIALKRTLKAEKIAFTEVPLSTEEGKTGNISIIYSHIIARDCKTSDFGCSTAINSLRMVTNREQFIKPALSDFQDAASAVNAVNSGLK